mgnify:CR=1 FL=1
MPNYESKSNRRNLSEGELSNKRKKSNNNKNTEKNLTDKEKKNLTDKKKIIPSDNDDKPLNFINFTQNKKYSFFESYSRKIVFQLFNYHEIYFFKYNFNYEQIKMKEQKIIDNFEKYIAQKELNNKFAKKEIENNPDEESSKDEANFNTKKKVDENTYKDKERIIINNNQNKNIQ